MVNTKVVRALTLVVALISLSDGANACLPAPTEPDNVYKFYSAIADALSVAKGARDKAKAALVSHRDVEMLIGLKTASSDFSCAAAYVDGYRTSRNEAMKSSADGFVTVMSALGFQTQQINQRLVSVLNGDEDSLGAGTRAERTAQDAERFSEAWGALPTALTLACLSGIRFRSPGEAGYFGLTAKERADVIRRLRLISPKVGARGDMPPLETSASILFDCLNDKRRKSSDER